MYGSRAVTLLVLISDDVINRILKLDIQTNILVYVTRCCTDLTSKVLKERTFCQSSALLLVETVPGLSHPFLGMGQRLKLTKIGKFDIVLMDVSIARLIPIIRYVLKRVSFGSKYFTKELKPECA